jgi:hypothetical protein
MDAYYIDTNVQDNGDHEVHKSNCTFMPVQQHRLFLGDFNNCQDALKEAKKTFPTTADGCPYCCPDCDTRKWFD